MSKPKSTINRDGVKTCGRCGETKPRPYFNVDRTRADGLHPYCAACNRARCRQRRIDSPDAVRAAEKASRLKRAARGAERVLAAAFQARHPYYLGVVSSNARAKSQGVAGTLNLLALRGRLEMWGGRCYLCGVDTHYVDHVIPFSRGGLNWPANIRPCCRSCNSTKKNRDWRLFVSGTMPPRTIGGEEQ